MRLRDLAHVRTGDKGDISQIAVIARTPADFERLARLLPVEQVVAHLRALTVREARRFELPELGALIFVLEGALDGGVTRSLALDAHGKALGAQLLDLDLDDRGEQS